jgi:hypothetical protein
MRVLIRRMSLENRLWGAPHETRTHLALDKDAPVSRPVQRIGVFRSLAILGGLHHYYARA